MSRDPGSPRRTFLKQAAGIAAQTAVGQNAVRQAAAHSTSISYPRVFAGPHLKMIAFPLGGVAAGSISLGGRGQLRDWEIFNRPNKGYAPSYGFPSIWAQAGNRKAVARVLESRILPPYEGASGLGSNNAPGLSRLAGAKFTGEFPLAHIDFEDPNLPVQVSLDAFSPFIPHDAEDSGLPVAILRYTARNPGRSEAHVAIAFSIDNPVTNPGKDTRANEYRSADGLSGLILTNPGLDASDPMRGEVVLAASDIGGARVTYWRGWPQSRWWNAPMLFWDDFSDDGELGAEPDPRGVVGSLSVKRSIAPGASASYTFLLAWRFPNRTPDWCGWKAPKGDEKTIIGNHYARRFASAWDAARFAAANLDRLETRTRLFAKTIRESSLPGAVIDAATANISTLATTTCFRTSDGEFHGFEGVDDHRGCCFGNCTHVWNYETSTAHLFPSFARSLRKAAFGYSMDGAGAIHFRQLLPDGKERSGFAATDGQMGQIVHAYLDWKLSGDIAWLREIWPRVKKALEFAWIPGGWDGDRDGVLEGVQHNTYDVEFYGPNPMCGIYYLAALRSCEEMARAVGDNSSAEYRRLFDQGSRWIDANLFNGQFYVQKIRGFAKNQIAPALRSDMGSEDTENPQYQVGEGCLVDQLVGQYLAEVAGLGPLLSQEHVRATLQSIYRYNYKRSMAEHDNVQRTFVLNDEAALLVCDYGKAPRPRIPFPYYAEVFTGLEYTTASHMLYAGMIREGIECISAVRARYDGEKRNPWDEAECGHHYARAMSAWSAFLALSGFRYDGATAAVIVTPRPANGQGSFQCFWSTGTGWGTFARSSAGLRLRVLAGTLPCRSCEIEGTAARVAARVNRNAIVHTANGRGERTNVSFSELLVLKENDELSIEVSA